MPPTPPAAYEVGARQSFYVDPYYTASGQYLLCFECVSVGEYCCVWSLPEGSLDGPSIQDIDASLAQSLASEFDSKYPLLLETYGQENYPYWYTGAKLNILCYDITDGWSPGGSFVGGYFSADTCLNSSAPIINIDTYPTMWQGEGEPTLDIARRVLVHEYTHLMIFAATGGTEDWLEEVIASSAEELCYPGSCIVPRIQYYDCMDGASMYDWMELFSCSDALYARGALFGQYLYTRFGNEVFGEILGYISEGMSEISAVYYATGVLLEDLVMQFDLAIMINDTSVLGGIYGFDTQPGYDPELYGIDDPYSLLSPSVYHGSSCVILGGGAIIVKPKYSAYYPPTDASSGLKYVGVKIKYPSYTVSFYGIEGELLSSQSVLEGDSAIAPEPPEIERYTFVKWSCDYSRVQADVQVYALYASNESILRLDANCDGRVGFADVTHICLCLSGICVPEPAFYLNADVDLDGRVELSDASALYAVLCGSE